MKWPFILRSTHQRELQDQARRMGLELAKASDAAAAAHGAKRFADSKAQVALVRAEAAEAQLKQLAGPVLDVVQRTSALTIVGAAPGPGEDAVKVVACLTLRGDILPVFNDHARVLGYAAQDLIHGAMSALRLKARADYVEKGGVS